MASIGKTTTFIKEYTGFTEREKEEKEDKNDYLNRLANPLGLKFLDL